VRVLDGAPAGHEAKPSKSDSDPHAQHVANVVFRCVHERLADALDGVTLQDVCDQVRESAEEPLEHRYVFHI
jgi:hypothetical protein